ncbi:MAG: hypothetical protein NTZ02_03070 [Candidatus Woesearchaeota archaeon]|nr:hypothetical protein [Candidatus Woesearchaeota archaeon]
MSLRINKELYVKHLEDICDGYEKYIMSKNKFSIPTDITNKFEFKPNSKEIEEFSKMLPEYRKLEDFKYHTAGYLTALMRSSRDKKFILNMKPLNEYGVVLPNIGDDLTNKKLVVNGNVGENLGLFARNCNITVNGDAQQDVGAFAQYCKIFINGSYGSISRDIKWGTRVYQLQDGEYKRVKR